MHICPRLLNRLTADCKRIFLVVLSVAESSARYDFLTGKLCYAVQIAQKMQNYSFFMVKFIISNHHYFVNGERADLDYRIKNFLAALLHFR